jgi:hypothetical protein
MNEWAMYIHSATRRHGCCYCLLCQQLHSMTEENPQGGTVLQISGHAQFVVKHIYAKICLLLS